MNISKVEPFELVEIIYLIRVCGIEMNSMGCLYWNFFSQQVPDLIKNGNVFKYRNNENSIGVIALNIKNSEGFEKLNWEYTEGKILTVRILIHPNWHNTGVCRELIAFAEQYAIDNNYKSIRLDVYANNVDSIKVLALLQYKKAGDIHLPFHAAQFICFEKEILS